MAFLTPRRGSASHHLSGYGLPVLTSSRPVTGLILVVVAVFLGGCSSGSFVRVKSVESTAVDAPALSRAVYWSSDRNTAEVYLTDLDPAALEPGLDLSRLRGRIVQLRMFMEPLAGSTPIANTACSVVVRHIVLADGAVGIYSGGGFLQPGSRPGKDSFSGHIEGATLRLTARTKSFIDPLGPATLDARFSAIRDEAAARSLAARVDEILLRIKGSGVQAAQR